MHRLTSSGDKKKLGCDKIIEKLLGNLPSKILDSRKYREPYLIDVTFSPNFI